MLSAQRTQVHRILCCELKWHNVFRFSDAFSVLTRLIRESLSVLVIESLLATWRQTRTLFGTQRTSVLPDRHAHLRLATVAAAAAMDPSTAPPAKRRRVDGGGTQAAVETPLPPGAQLGRDCPYMHTISCAALDFDFEKVCSVSLEAHNVYTCLVCGKYFQGRGPASHAFAHALDAGHHVFLNLTTEAAYSLPDNLRIVDPLIDRIVAALHPRFSPDSVASLDSTALEYSTLDGEPHLQGVTALDALHAADYANAIFHALFCVAPLRAYLLLTPRSSTVAAPHSRLLPELAALAQKVWSPAAFRARVSPHEVMRAVATASGGRFGPLARADPVDFFAWLVHVLSREIARAEKGAANGDGGGGEGMAEGDLGVERRRRRRRLLRDCFQGKLEVTSRQEDAGAENDGRGPRNDLNGRADRKTETRKESAFWFLSLDLPPKALFKDASDRTLVAQVGLEELLGKYSGHSQHHVVETGERLSFRLLQLPPYLVLTLRRVTKSKFAVEKNHAVVHCPVTGLDMSELLQAAASGDAARAPLLYRMIAFVVQDGPHDDCSYRVVVRHAATGKWFSIDSSTVTEVLPQVASLSHTCMLLYERE